MFSVQAWSVKHSPHNMAGKDVLGVYKIDIFLLSLLIAKAEENLNSY